MANHKSAKKRILRNEKKRLENKSRISRIRTFVKNCLKVISLKKDSEKVALLANVNSELAKGVKKGIVSKKKMARTMSKMAKITTK